MNKDKILIVDDEEVVVESLCIYLEKMDYYVKTALNGREGLSILRKESFDMAIVDYNLGDMDGLDFMYRAKMIPGVRDMKYILVSGEIKDYDDKYMNLNIGCFLKKPFSLNVIAEKINEILMAEKK